MGSAVNVLPTDVSRGRTRLRLELERMQGRCERLSILIDEGLGRRNTEAEHQQQQQQEPHGMAVQEERLFANEVGLLSVAYRRTDHE